MMDFILAWLTVLPGYVVPLLLASLGVLLSERAGILNLCPEGFMAVGAMTGALLCLAGHDPWTAVLAGTLSGLGLSLVFGLAVVVFRVEQTLAGLAIVALGLGITGVIGRSHVQKPFPGLPRLSETAWGADLPRLLGQQNMLLPLSLLLLALIAWFLARSPAGLRLRAVGEDPAAADISGVDVQRVQLGAVLASGALGGLAGAFLSVASAHVWVEGMVAGRGWVVVALVIFARWRPLRCLWAALLFGGTEAIMPRLQALGVDFPVYLGAMLPYVLTLAVLALASMRRGARSGAPAALGLTYLRQDKH
ncbi:ABC transporter permease [Pseudooceanicola sp. HF7]|uniref:ABC transporter permease n=1 Tax=Pseudooceanicola sp. HF7 TaxID=2721560 RepID=UPI0014310202|nr:ABC transporter permease [Pseudooceanicola sp. HF7]NIZ07810.1 ABC transporter permease [Pseudooceanicola sp. HF7]